MPAAAAKLTWLEQIPLESFAKMREVERYQLSIAEKHYIDGEYKIALDEYEKFMSLYETSAGAPYAQLMWSHCQSRLRNVNTAIREGFQSVIDYWPNGPEAVLAGFMIARSYQDIGEIEKAKDSYTKLMETHPNSDVTVLAKVSLLDMARTEKDDESIQKYLEELTFNTQRSAAVKDHCDRASRELAGLYFRKGDWNKGAEALKTTYQNELLAGQLYEVGRDAVAVLLRSEETKTQGESLGNQMIAYFDAAVPADLTTDAGKALARANLNRVAAVQSAMKRSPDVFKTYERIGKLLGSDDTLLGQIAGYHRELGERDKAREIYAKFADGIAGRRNLAGMDREDRKFPQAIATYRELVEQDADRIDDYLWAIAECQEESGDLKGAIQSYRQVDRFPTTYFRMASCFRRLKQFGEALALYNQAKSTEGSAPEASLQSGYTYEEAGQRENAIKSFQLTCRTYPKSGQASQAHAHLQTKYQINVTLGGAKDE